MATGTSCDFIKDLMPKVRISKVTLSSVGGNNLPPDDPHIMHPDEGTSYEPITNTSGDIIGYDVTSVIDTGRQAQIDAYNDGADPETDITIDFCVEETIVDGSDGMISSWFSNEDFTKYFIIKIAILKGKAWQSTMPTVGKISDASAYLAETSSGDAVENTGGSYSDAVTTEDDSLARRDDIYKYLSGIDDSPSDALESLNVNMLVANPLYTQQLTYNVQEEILNLHGASSMELSLSHLYEYGYAVARSEGGTTFKVPFTTLKNPDTDGSTPDCTGFNNIMIYAWTEMDEQAMEDDFGIDFNDGAAEGTTLKSLDYQLVTVLSSDSVIANNSFDRSSTNGATRSSVVISDVRDLVSVIPQPDPVMPDFSADPAGLATKKGGKTYVSDMMPAKKLVMHAPGNASVNYFTVGTMQSWIENSRLGAAGSMYYNFMESRTESDPSVLKIVIENYLYEVKQIKINRERIDTSQGHADRYHKEMVILVDQGSIRSTRTTEDKSDNVYSHGTYEHTLHSMFTDVDTVYGPDNSKFDVQLNTYAFFDLDVSRFSDGEYQYSVEIKIQDKFAQTLSWMLDRLESLITIAESYYNFVTLPGSYNWRTNRFRSDVNEGAVTNPAYNIEFIPQDPTWPDSWNTGYTTTSYFIDRALTDVMGAIQIILNPEIDKMGAFVANVDDWKNAMSIPSGATPTSILQVIQKAHNIAQVGRTLVGYIKPVDLTQSSRDIDEADKYTPITDMETFSPQSTQEKDLISIEHTFPTTIHARNASIRGLEFLNSTPWTVYGGSSGHSIIVDEFPHESQTVSQYLSKNYGGDYGGYKSWAVGVDHTYANHRTVTHAVADYSAGHYEYWNLDRPGGFNEVALTLKSEGVMEKLFAQMVFNKMKDSAGLVAKASRLKTLGDYASEEGMSFVSSEEGLAHLALSSEAGTSTVAVFDTSVDMHYSLSDADMDLGVGGARHPDTVAAHALSPYATFSRTEFETNKIESNISTYMFETEQYYTAAHGLFRTSLDDGYAAKKRFLKPDGGRIFGSGLTWEESYPAYDGKIAYPRKLEDSERDIERDDVLSSPEGTLFAKLKYGTLVTVKYLSGWAEDNVIYQKGSIGRALRQTRPNFGYPIWDIVERSMLESMPTGKKLLCKLEPMDLQDLGVSYPESLGLPIYNQYFIIEK